METTIIQRPDSDIRIEVDRPEARGVVILRPCLYGLEIILPEISEETVGLIDLGAEPRLPKLIIESPEQTEDPLAYVHFLPGQTRVEFLDGAAKGYQNEDGSSYFAFDTDQYPLIGATPNLLEAAKNVLTFLENLGYIGGDVHDDLESAIEAAQQAAA